MFEGILKSYSEKNGFGFIECPPTKQQYGCDVFVHRSEGQRMSIGSRVKFQVHLNKKGQPQANNVEVVAQHSSPDVGSLSHTGTVDQNSADSSGLVGPFLGRVKSNNPQQGYGFITCDETQALYNADVFLNRTEGHGLEPGQEVYFQVQTNHQGKPQAARVSVVSRKRSFESLSVQGSEMLPTVPIDANAVANWQSMGWQLNGLQQAQQQAQWQSGYWQQNVQNGLFTGNVKNFNHEQGYGFIQCDETFPLFLSDIFLHQNEADGLQVGSQVSFRIHFNGNGQPQANSVSAVGGVAKRARTDAGPRSTPEQLHSLPLFPEGPFRGLVKSYNVSTGYGFIECAVAKALFGHDVFLHKKQVVQGLDVGSKVSFQVRLNKLSQPQADNVELLTDELT
jgi:cold shock CspA family protein